MREIEIKAVIRDEAQIRNSLDNLGAVITRKKNQVDTIYLPVGRSYDNLKDVNILRIRKESEVQEVITFNLKKHISNELDCVEHETKISSFKEMESIILMLGYYEAISVNKFRESGTIQGYTFNIDSVDGLGKFLELEYMVSDSDHVNVEQIQDQMSIFLTSLSVAQTDIVIFSYDTELYRRSRLA
jgi:adenylate cyclase, class 2